MKRLFNGVTIPTDQEIADYKRKNMERLKRRIEMGYVRGVIRPNGVFVDNSRRKGIPHPYSTRELITLVSKRLDDVGVVHINSKHQLQIRGKHLRRLLKAMPDVECTGRTLVRKNQ